MSKGALIGEFTLNTTQYYDSIYSKLSNANASTTIRAISLLSPEVWNNDLHQKKFLEFNIEARRNGANIKRLFIASDEQISSLWKIIIQQLKSGFEIKTLHPRIFSEHTNLDDSIIFENSVEARCYKTIQFYDNPYKLKGARLILNKESCKEQISSFDQIWKLGIIPALPAFRVKVSYQPPGEKMKTYALSHEVVTCEEAANARNIPLANELKTLILKAPSGFIAVHLPGDGELSLRAVKNQLEIKNVKIADPEQILKIGLQSGTVSAVLNPVWNMTHLVSKRVLSLAFVMTNNGTTTGYFKFDPIIILDANSTIIGNFERDDRIIAARKEKLNC
jgi:prolyl-tRNA editing enzyme YbaK/EbsC (Cys-tRNA(Pro) deacylase)